MSPSAIVLVVLCLMLVCFITRIIPSGATALIGCLVMVWTGVIDLPTAFAPFTGNIVLLLIGVMIIGAAFVEVGNADDVGNLIIKWFSGSEKKLIICLTAIVTVVSAFLSNTASVAIFLPIIDAIAKASNGKIKRKNLYMPIAIGSVIGGNAILFGSTPQLAAQAILEKSTAAGVRELGLFDLLPGTIILAAVIIVFYLVVGCKLQNKWFDFEENEGVIVEKQEIKQNKFKKIMVYVSYIVFVALFISGLLSIGVSAIVGALVCVVSRCITEKKALKSVGWSTIILLGGLLGFSEAVSASNLCPEIVSFVLGFFQGNTLPWFAGYIILVVLAVVLTSVVSNTAVATILTPIAIEMAVQTGGNPMLFVIAIIFASNISFCTPIATPPIMMTAGVGYRFSDYFKLGGVLSVLLTLVVIFAIPLMYNIIL